MKTYNIIPVQVGMGLQTSTATKIYFSATYTPNSTEMWFAYALMDDNEVSLYSGDGTLGEDVLAGWGNDDNYIINAMATKVGVVLA
jgi:hypothetical protein